MALVSPRQSTEFPSSVKQIEKILAMMPFRQFFGRGRMASIVALQPAHVRRSSQQKMLRKQQRLKSEAFQPRTRDSKDPI
eukprot:symbB.v1.2.014918.t1/scaffold1100.1/size328752/8